MTGRSDEEAVEERDWRKCSEGAQERTIEPGDTWTQWRQIFVEANLGCRS